ncbi:MAG: hypothetical protein JWQ81_3734 [Amycolatopsis sp.]|nr:hypothetical protein [Amycolatopsis sp.]
MRLCERIVVTLLGPYTQLSTGIPTTPTTPDTATPVTTTWRSPAFTDISTMSGR